MSKKDLFIGNFRIRYCLQYGEYTVISNLRPGDELMLEYDSNERLVFVKGKDKSTNNWVILGELEATGHVKDFILPMLQCNSANNIFESKLAVPIDNKQMNINCLYVSIWAKK